MERPSFSPEDYLKLPYARMLIPDEESGTFMAEIVEFPGCISQGDNAQEAFERLEEVAINWIEAALDLGQEIPPPSISHGYSGRFALRLPKSLHRQVSLAAERDGTSVNQFIVTAIAEKVGASNLYDALSKRIESRIVQTAVNEASLIIEKFTIEKRAESVSGSELFFIPLEDIQGVSTNARN